MNTAEFLTELYGRMPVGYIELRCFNRNGGRPERLWRPLPLGEVKTMTRLHDMNVDGFNIYHRMGVSLEKRATKDAIWALPALWVDIDDKSPEALKRLHDMYWPPSITVFSGGGWHGYWTFDEPLIVTPENLGLIERTLQGMAFACGGDEKVKDVSRILRTPGFYNVKPEYGDTPPLAEVADFTPCWFDFEWLCKVYEPMAPINYVPTITRDTSAFTGKYMPRWIQDYLDNGVRSHRNDRAFAVARALFDNGFDYGEVEQMILSRAAADGLIQDNGEGSVRSTIASAYRAPRGIPNIPSHMKSFMAVEDGKLDGVA
jgi:hypothetical protein